MYFLLGLIHIGGVETTGKVLKSIMAIFLYCKHIDDLKHHATDPADFSKYLYQPEKDINDERIHHREDHNHLLKRIVSRLRGGHIPVIDLIHFKRCFARCNNWPYVRGTYRKEQAISSGL